LRTVARLSCRPCSPRPSKTRWTSHCWARWCDFAERPGLGQGRRELLPSEARQRDAQGRCGEPAARPDQRHASAHGYDRMSGGESRSGQAPEDRKTAPMSIAHGSKTRRCPTSRCATSWWPWVSARSRGCSTSHIRSMPFKRRASEACGDLPRERTRSPADHLG
jgi:hypothetical protein